MDRDFRPVVVPLGPRLRLMAARLLGARRARLNWLAQSDGVNARVASLMASAPGLRHARVEVDGLMLGDETHAGDDGLLDPAASAEPERLPVVVRERLRSHVGDAADAMRIHHDDRAHHIAESHRAEAVASGADVYFRHGRYRPHDEAGFALLAHEATHVTRSLRPNAGWQRPMLGERDAEETVAIALERDIRRRAVPSGRGTATMASARTVARADVVTPPPAAPAKPMTAAADRPLDMAPPTPPIDMERLRQTLARDLMRQIRAEMERGG